MSNKGKHNNKLVYCKPEYLTALFLYIAERPHEHYRQVFFVHSELQGENLQVTIYLNLSISTASPNAMVRQ